LCVGKRVLLLYFVGRERAFVSVIVEDFSGALETKEREKGNEAKRREFIPLCRIRRPKQEAVSESFRRYCRASERDKEDESRLT
jgi:hypothetical protein